ncbi:MAG: MFS transporter [Candidatus Humimicrobiaceae bacterium]
MQKKKNLKLFYLAYFILGFVIPIFDPLYPYFSRSFNVGYDKIGLVFFGGSLTAIISMISAGRISDKFPLRKLFLWSFAISFAGFAVFGIFHNFTGLIITVIIVNVGLNIFWPAAYAKVFHDHNENYSTMYVKLERFYYLATALGPLLISLLLYLNLSPRYIFAFLLLLFILLFSIFYVGYRDKTSNALHAVYLKTKQAQNVNADNRAGQKPSLSKNLNKHKKEKLHKKITRFFTPVVIFANISLTLFGGVMTGTSAWLTTYFTSFNIAVSLSSIFVAIYWFSTFIGLQILSKIIGKIREEKVLFYGGIVSVVSLICFSLINIIYIKIIFLMLVGISIAGIYPLCGAITVNANPKSAGTSSGVTIAMGLLGGLIVSPVMGFVAQYLSKSYVPYVLIILAVLGTIMSAILLRINLNKNKGGIKV